MSIFSNGETIKHGDPREIMGWIKFYVITQPDLLHTPGRSGDQQCGGYEDINNLETDKP